MSNRKITDMVALTAPASDDVLPIVDISEAAAVDKNKKISIEELFKGVPDGTAAAPSIAFESDSDSGIFLAGTNTVGITTAGTQRVTVDSSGNVGINVDASDSIFGKLHVKGGNDANFLFTTASSEASLELFNDAGSANVPLNVRASEYKVKIGSSEKLRLDSSGNLGVGTSAPGQLLHLNSSASTAIQISDGTNNQFISSIKTAGNFVNGSTAGDILIRGQSGFAVSSNNGSSVAMRIDSSGRVGIGTSSPGDLNSNGDDLVVGSGSGNRGITIYTATNGTGNIYFADGTTGSSPLRGGITYNHSDNSLKLLVNASERLRIDSSGNVGIGTASPGYKLEVTEASANSFVRFDGANSAQLVFRNATSNVFEINAGGGNDELSFGTAGNNERMRIDSSGNVILGFAGNNLFFKNAFNNSESRIQCNAGSNSSNFRFLVKDSGSESETVRFQSSGGISFNGDTAAANALDDYEEGTWTPTAIGYSGTMAVQSANYRKVGSLCFVHTYVSFSNTTDSSGVEIGGLPFTAGGINNNYYIMSAQTNGGSQEFHLRGQGTSTSLTAVHLSGTNGDDKPSYTSFALKWIMISGCFITT